MSLYSITTEYQRLIADIEDGIIPEEAIADTLDSVTGEWEERAEAVVSAIKNISAEARAIAAEEAALKARKLKKENTVKRLSQYFASAMLSIGRISYESAKHSVSFKKSEAVQITDMDAFLEYARENLPDALRRKETVEPDKDFIKKLLKESELPFVTLEIRQNIQIK